MANSSKLCANLGTGRHCRCQQCSNRNVHKRSSASTSAHDSEPANHPSAPQMRAGSKQEVAMPKYSTANHGDIANYGNIANHSNTASHDNAPNPQPGQAAQTPAKPPRTPVAPPSYRVRRELMSPPAHPLRGGDRQEYPRRSDSNISLGNNANPEIFILGRNIGEFLQQQAGVDVGARFSRFSGMQTFRNVENPSAGRDDSNDPTRDNATADASSMGGTRGSSNGNSNSSHDRGGDAANARRGAARRAR